MSADLISCCSAFNYLIIKIEKVGGDAVRRLTEMGFAEADARAALVNNNWDENAAVNALVSSMG